MSKHPHGHAHNGAKTPPSFEGVISVSVKNGGMVRTLTGEVIEIFPESLNTALHGDHVKGTLIPGKKRFGKPVGIISEVVSRTKTRFVGIAVLDNGRWFLHADDRRVYVVMHLANAENFALYPNVKVSADLVRFDDPDKMPKAEIVEVLGIAGQHETEMKAAVANAGFDWNFPRKVEEEAQAIESNKTPFIEAEIAKRRDMRSATTFTIDPFDAKDFDDAISVDRLPSGELEIGVHIADVSAYVTPGTAMDDEAQKRGTAIYLVDRTIPMLPGVLSNEVCSLNEKEDKLIFSAVFTVDPKTFVVTNRWLGKTAINSNKRFSYEEAQEILNAKEGLLHEELYLADQVALAFRRERFKDGSVAFETDEVKFVLDEKGWPIDVRLKRRQETNMMIEDLMLMANRAVAEYINTACEKDDNRCLFVWRIHDAPNPERIMELSIYLKALGYEFEPKEGIVSPQDINALFKQIGNAPEKEMIETATIRSMAKAIYSTKNIGHFGLAFSYYTHFTSPIRRYPDLMVHRILRSHLSGNPISMRETMHYERMALHSSEREVAAAEAERESVKLKQVQYMSDKVGQEFTGIITGVTDWGLFVAETKSKSEGMARLKSLSGDTYTRGDGGYRVVGAETGQTYALGQLIKIKLAGVNLEDRMIDWEILGPA